MSTLFWLAPILVASAALNISGVFAQSSPLAALALLAAAVAATVLAGRAAGRRGVELASGAAAVVAATIAIACSAPFLLELGTRFQRIDAISPVAYGVARLLGIEVRLHDGVIYRSASDLVAISTNWGKLGLLPAAWIMVACATTVLIHTRSRPVRTLLSAGAITAAYFVLRYAFLIGMALRHPDPTYQTGEYPFVVSIFVAPLWQAFTLLPLALFLGRFLPWRSDETRVRSLAPGGALRTSLAALLAILAGAVWAVDTNYEAPGARKSGRVVIDELHSRSWSSSLSPLDTESYGRDTIYNYTLLVRYLSQFYDVRVNDSAGYSDESLADVDVLILKTATAPFAAPELDAIESFVRRGGGLFVIGDHTDLLGMTTNLNAVCSRFSMAFRPDACNRLEDGQTGVWTDLPWMRRPLLADVEHMTLMTSCTLEVPSHAQRVMVLRNAFSDPLDYSNPSFFGDVAPDLDDDLGAFVVCAADKVDKGRIVLFADSTMFSSFALMLEDRAQLLHNIVDWLDHENGELTDRRWTAVAIAFLLLGVLVVGARLSPVFWAAQFPAALLFGATLGVAIVARWNERTHVRGRAQTALPTVAFLSEGCDFELPNPLIQSDIAVERAFDGMFTWVARVGALPRLERLPKALARRAVVAVRPDERLIRTQARALEAFVRDGGALMVLSNDRAALTPLLARFELLLSGTGPSDYQLTHASSGAPVTVCGVLSRSFRAEYGAGSLTVTLAPDTFSRSGMGLQTEAVDEHDPRREVFDELFGLLRAMNGAAK